MNANEGLVKPFLMILVAIAVIVAGALLLCGCKAGLSGLEVVHGSAEIPPNAGTLGDAEDVDLACPEGKMALTPGWRWEEEDLQLVGLVANIVQSGYPRGYTYHFRNVTEETYPLDLSLVCADAPN